MSKDSIAVINGHEYKYRYNPETKGMDYLGPVGDAPPLSQEQFRELFQENNDRKEELDQFLDEMKEAVRLTKETGHEHGFTVCDKGDRLEATPMCEGDVCEVHPVKCKWPNTFMEFHTHPPGSIILPSPHDMLGALAEQTEYVCMGSTFQGGNIRCYRMNYSDESWNEFVGLYHKSNYASPEEKSRNRTRMVEIMAEGIAGNNKMLIKVREWKDFL
jgi:hypothetical protein